MFHTQWVIDFATPPAIPLASRGELRQTLRDAKVQRQKSEDLLANTERLLDQARELIERAARGGADAPAKRPARTTIRVRTRPSRR